MFYRKKLMVHNGILMETNRISVMVSIWLLLFVSKGALINFQGSCKNAFNYLK